jgi:nucleoside-diphosphate-sugar epimerase
MTRAVVVGGQGFLGGAIASDLLRRGDEVIVFDIDADRTECDEIFGTGAVRVVRGDILDPAALRSAFRGADEVYHLAGMLGTSELEDNVGAAIMGNVCGSVNVFEAAIACGVPAVFNPAKPNVWRNTYTITKYAAEQFAELYSEESDVRITSLRYFNAYGPRQCLGPIRKLVPTFAVQALCDLPLTVYGDGEQTVDMIFSEDLARLTVDFLRSGYEGAAPDCGRGVPFSVLEIAECVRNILGSRSPIVHLPMRRGETPSTHLVADVDALEGALGPLEFTDFERSLEETLHWYAGRPAVQLAAAASALGAA